MIGYCGRLSIHVGVLRALVSSHFNDHIMSFYVPSRLINISSITCFIIDVKDIFILKQASNTYPVHSDRALPSQTEDRSHPVVHTESQTPGSPYVRYTSGLYKV